MSIKITNELIQAYQTPEPTATSSEVCSVWFKVKLQPILGTLPQAAILVNGCMMLSCSISISVCVCVVVVVGAV